MCKDLKAKMSRLCFRKDKKVKETGGERTRRKLEPSNELITEKKPC